MHDRVRFFISRLRERLWLRPLAMAILSTGLVFLAKLADDPLVRGIVPGITAESVEALLKVMAASMLVIAVFAVGSMVSSYASAARSATPRSFPLVVSDDVSQNALSVFIGSFIFSIVALTAMMNGWYGKGGRFAVFVLTLLVFATVVVVFMRWVDRIARLGRLGTTIEKAEAATARALRRRRREPTLGGAPLRAPVVGGMAIYSDSIGYVQQIEMEGLQEYAKEADIRLAVAALPGTYTLPGRPLAHVIDADGAAVDERRIAAQFQIGDDRTFDDDPRFGFVVLSEIASRALSPAVNDPGTGIAVVHSFVRLFKIWGQPSDEDAVDPRPFDRIAVPELSVHDMFDDAFASIARDGAKMAEVGIRLQKALQALASLGHPEMKAAAEHHARQAIARAEEAMALPDDVEAIRAAGMFAGQGG